MKERPSSISIGGSFDNTYSRLPSSFFNQELPTTVKDPKLVKFNYELADELGLHVKNLSDKELAEVFSGNIAIEGSEPIAQAYAGHQFGNFNPHLGDGRAILLGELLTSERKRYDLQLKGSGPTKYSRRGDGRAAIGPMLREYLISEFMFSVGIPTTRSLAVTTTGEKVNRETELPGAILTRVAASHIRIGTFELFASKGDWSSVKVLADYTINRHYPELTSANNPYLEFLNSVIDRQAALVAKWMSVGFIHGVMNTDNMTLSGETIDYGPCAFMDFYDPNAVYSSIDRNGRYAYANQPKIALWNLSNLASCLMPLLSKDENVAGKMAEYAISDFWKFYVKHWLTELKKKFGLSIERDEDGKLISGFFDLLKKDSVDFTLAFRNLSSVLKLQPEKLKNLFKSEADLDVWLKDWKLRLSIDGENVDESIKKMDSANPIYIPRNHTVEKALTEATVSENYQHFEELLKLLRAPFEEQKGFEKFALPPSPDEVVEATFCGT